MGFALDFLSSAFLDAADFSAFFSLFSSPESSANSSVMYSLTVAQPCVDLSATLMSFWRCLFSSRTELSRSNPELRSPTFIDAMADSTIALSFSVCRNWSLFPMLLNSYSISADVRCFFIADSTLVSILLDKVWIAKRMSSFEASGFIFTGSTRISCCEVSCSTESDQ